MSYQKGNASRGDFNRSAFKSDIAQLLAQADETLELLTGNEIGVLIKNKYKLLIEDGTAINTVKLKVTRDETEYSIGELPVYYQINRFDGNTIVQGGINTENGSIATGHVYLVCYKDLIELEAGDYIIEYDYVGSSSGVPRVGYGLYNLDGSYAHEDNVWLDSPYHFTMAEHKKVRIQFNVNGEADRISPSDIASARLYKVGENTNTCLLNITAAVNDGCVNLKFRERMTQAPGFNADLLFVFGSTDLFGFSFNADGGRNYAMMGGLYRGASAVSDVSAVPRLPYYYDQSGINIETMSSKVFVLNDEKLMEAAKLSDCSTLKGDQLYPIDGKRYYAVDDNTMMEV